MNSWLPRLEILLTLNWQGLYCSRSDVVRNHSERSKSKLFDQQQKKSEGLHNLTLRRQAKQFLPLSSSLRIVEDSSSTICENQNFQSSSCRLLNMRHCKSLLKRAIILTISSISAEMSHQQVWTGSKKVPSHQSKAGQLEGHTEACLVAICRMIRDKGRISARVTGAT